ncbi:MAG: Dabb family protein [Clostridiaceae bacterium]|nr:Dabb family protein [Clostridiaceae bacterium]
MIIHIVMWKLKEVAEGASKEENAVKIKEKLEALKDKIEVIKSIEVGINVNLSDMAYDVVLNSQFDNLDALNEYQNHPEHIKAGEFVGAVTEKRVVADYVK